MRRWLTAGLKVCLRSAARLGLASHGAARRWLLHGLHRIPTLRHAQQCSAVSRLHFCLIKSNCSGVPVFIRWAFLYLPLGAGKVRNNVRPAVVHPTRPRHHVTRSDRQLLVLSLQSLAAPASLCGGLSPRWRRVSMMQAHASKCDSARCSDLWALQSLWEEGEIVFYRFLSLVRGPQGH